METTDKTIGRSTYQKDRLQEGYELGFKFAINYLIAWMPTNFKFDKEIFKAFVKQFVGEEVIKDDYLFKDVKYYQGGVNYPSGACPNQFSPPDHVSCVGKKMQPVPKPGSTPKELIEWMESVFANKE
jgi:hypothetical protein